MGSNCMWLILQFWMPLYSFGSTGALCYSFERFLSLFQGMPVVQLVYSLSVVLRYRGVVIMGMFPYMHIFWFQLFIYSFSPYCFMPLRYPVIITCDHFVWNHFFVLLPIYISHQFHVWHLWGCLLAQSCHSSPLSGHCPQINELPEYLKN